MRASGIMDKWEDRPSQAGALDFFIQDTINPAGIISEDMQTKARQAFSRDLKVPVIDYDGGISIGNTRSHIIADSENASAFYNVTFVTYTFGFTQAPTLYINNEIDGQRDFNRKMQKYTNLLVKTMDTACIAALDTNKTRVFGDNLGYDTTGNVLGFTLAQEQKALGALDPIMNSNDFYGGLHIIGNRGVQHLVERLAEKSTYNSENKTIQYLDKRLHYTNRIANAANHGATMFAVNEGSVGLLFRYDREAEAGTISQHSGYTWGIQQIPFLGLPMGTMEYESVGNYSGLAGAASADMLAARKYHFGFSFDVAYVVAYNSDLATIASPIIKADIADA